MSSQQSPITRLTAAALIGSAGLTAACSPGPERSSLAIPGQGSSEGLSGPTPAPSETQTPSPSPTPSNEMTSPSNIPSPSTTTPSPSPSKTASPSRSASPSQSSSPSPSSIPTPDVPIGKMAAADWTFDERFSDLVVDFEIKNNPGDSDEFLQLYETDIDNDHIYVGVQTTTGRVIFSKFGSMDRAEVQPNGPAYAYHNDNEGEFVSLRWDRGQLEAGKYRAELVRGAEEGSASGRNYDWYEYWLTTPTDGRVLVGSMRITRANEQRATIAASGMTWIEAWQNNNADGTIYPVAKWQVDILDIKGDGQSPGSFETSYGHDIDGEFVEMPNNNVSQRRNGTVEMRVGGDTQRLDPPQRCDYRTVEQCVGL